MQLLLKMTVKVAGYFTVFLLSSTREHDQSPIPKLIVLRLFFRKYLVSFRNCSSETMSHYFAFRKHVVICRKCVATCRNYVAIFRNYGWVGGGVAVWVGSLMYPVMATIHALPLHSSETLSLPSEAILHASENNLPKLHSASRLHEGVRLGCVAGLGGCGGWVGQFSYRRSCFNCRIQLRPCKHGMVTAQTTCVWLLSQPRS